MQASHPRPRTDSSRSSARAPADDRIAHLFASFEAIWPRKWRVTEQSEQVWGFAIARLDDQAIAAGLRHVIDEGEAWPPEPGAFASLCRDAQRKQRAEIEASIQTASPAPVSPREAAWSAVAGTFALRMLGRPTRSRHEGWDVNRFVDAHQPQQVPANDVAVRALFRSLREAFDAEWHRTMRP